MSSSGTYTFQLGYDDVFDEGFERCGIDPATLTQRHLASALRSANLLMAEWSARKITLFSVDEQTQLLTQGQGDDASPYSAAAGTILMLEAAIKRAGVFTPVFVISREMYFRIPKRTQQGLPTNVWYNIATNQYNLWTVPENSTDELHYKRLRRKQDVTAMSENPDAPYLYADALCAGMACKLSLKFAPDRYTLLSAEHEKALALAQSADREYTDVGFDVRLAS
jgi:hypothetical protein